MRGFQMARGVIGLVACLLLATGCSDGKGPSGSVQGKVTYDGKAVPDANVQLQSVETGAAAAAKSDTEGNYRIEVIPAGKYVVTITPVDDAPVAGTAKVKLKERPDIPTKYRTTATSGLTTSVAKGPNTFDAKMTAEK